MLHIGIDEAGYGPLLGPLVIGLSALRWQAAPKRGDRELDRGFEAIFEAGDALGDPLREALAGVVAPAGGCESRARLPVPVGDSKPLYNRDGSPGLARALGVLSAARGVSPPQDLGDLIVRHADGGVVGMAGLPWYAEAEATQLPLYPWSGPLEQAFESAGLEALDWRVWPVVVPTFNRAVSEAGSKATVLGTCGGCLLLALLDGLPGEDAYVVFDRHGSRRHYEAYLEGLFPFAGITPRLKDQGESRYTVVLPDRHLYVRFVTKGDARDLAVAWASAAAKLTRELFMAPLNAWFTAQDPSVRPTAGYVVDGRRFVRDVEGLLARASIPLDSLVRCR